MEYSEQNNFPIPESEELAPLLEESPTDSLEEEITPQAPEHPEKALPEAPAAEEDPTALRAEIDRLRSLLDQKDREQKKAMHEMEEFSRLFPTTSVRQIPDEVWQEVEAGIPLSAAYALYEKKNRMDRLHAQEVNRKNAERSAGNAGTHTANEYFSPEEVRAMSPSEVRENFKKIRESMKKWHH